MTGVLIRRRDLDTDTHRGKITSSHREKMTVIDKPGRDATEETCQHLDLGLLPSRTVRKQIPVV